MFKFPDFFSKFFLKFFISIFEKFSNLFITFHLRPSLADRVKYLPSANISHTGSKIAIVMQGPILMEDDFTFETLKLYSKIFSQHQIIFSTWEDEELSHLNKIKSLPVELVLNSKPEFSGASNVNFQITSSSGGIKRAKDLNSDYVFKTRSDQRIYSKDAISVCLACLKQFPLVNIENQIERIVSFNLNTFKYRLYGISDMNNFGNISDMEKYWCADLDTRKEEEFSETKSLKEYAMQRYAEVFFVTSFLNLIEREITWTLKDSWEVYSENFCILDVGCLDLLWKKYSHEEYRN